MVRLLRQIVRDAVDLARAVGKNERPSVREVVREVARNDSFQVLVLARLRERARRFHILGMNHALRRIQTVVYGVELGNEVTLGQGVWFVHPIGTVVGGDARIGDRVRFMGNNTVGEANADGNYPTIEDDVLVGAGARILGKVRVGARSIIGANAVVLDDVPPDTTVVGIPARPIQVKHKRDRYVS